MILPLFIAALWLGGIAVACRWAGMCWMRTLLTVLLMPILQFMGYLMVVAGLCFVAGIFSLLVEIVVPAVSTSSGVSEPVGILETVVMGILAILPAIPVLWFTRRHFLDERDTIRDHGTEGLRGGNTTLGVHQHVRHVGLRYHGSSKGVKTIR